MTTHIVKLRLNTLTQASLGTFYLMRASLIWFLFLLSMMVISFLPESSWARVTFPYQLSSPGDRSVVRLKVSNIGSTPRTFYFGPDNGQRANQEIEAYESQDYFFQCLKRNNLQKTPELLFTLGRENYTFDSWDSHTSDPSRIIWNQGAPQTSHRIKWTLSNAIQSIYHQSVISTRADTMLSEMSIWNKTQLFMTSLKALSDLSQQQCMALRVMVAMGTTLVIGTGDMEGDEALLQEFASIGLGEVRSNSETLLEHLPRTSSYRMLFPQNEAYPLVIVDQEVIAVESPLGLGKVRVLAVRLNELTTGDITTRVLTSDTSAKDQLQEWLDLSMPPLTAPHRLLSDQVWLLILLIPLIFKLSRRRWKFGAVGTVIWVSIALANPPLFAPTSIRQAHLLYIPMKEGGIAIAQVDLNSFDRGGRVEALQGAPITLLSTETQGACLVSKANLDSSASSNSKEQVNASDQRDQRSEISNSQHTSWLILDSDLGERQRFKYLTYVPRIPNTDAQKPEEHLSKWPIGPWSGATLTSLKLSRKDLILPTDLSGLKAWRLPEFPPKVDQNPLILKRSDHEL